MAQPFSPTHLVKTLRALLFSVLIFAPLLVVNFFQVFSMLWKAASPYLFRRYNSFWGHIYWSYVAWMAQTFGGLTLEISGDQIPPHENAVVLANHQSGIDTIVQLMVGWRYRRLGDIKFFIKDVIKWMPGPGWGMVFLECIFVKRNWSEDRERVLNQLHRFKKWRVPVWVVIYPEGTRLKPSRLAVAREFARAQGMPLPQRVLIPRIRGFQATLEGLGDHLHAVYDMTIAYPGPPPAIWDLLSGQGGRIKVEIRRYPFGELPVDQDARAAWLLQIFQDKDRRLAQADAERK